MGRFYEVLLPVLVVALVLLILKLNVNPAGPPLQLNAEIYTATHSRRAGIMTMKGGVAEFFHSEPTMSIVEPLSLFYLQKRTDAMYLSPSYETNSLSFSEFLLKGIYQHDRNRYGSMLFNDTLRGHVNISRWKIPIEFRTYLSLLHNTSFFHALPVMASELSGARFRANLDMAGLLIHDSQTASPPLASASGSASASASTSASASAFSSWFSPTSSAARRYGFAYQRPSPPISSPIRRNTSSYLFRTPSSSPRSRSASTLSAYTHNFTYDQAYYRTFNHPLPLTEKESLRIQTFLSLFAALFVLIPFCYLPASFVIFIVKERSVKAKHLQLVSGVNPRAYWIATFVFDILNYLVVCAAVMGVFFAYGNEEFVGGGGMSWATFCVLIMYGLAAIPLSYLYSFIFENHTSAQVGIAGLHFLFGFVLVITSFILDNVDSTRETNAFMKHIYRFSPPYNLGEALINLSTIDFFTLFNGVKQSPFDWDITGRSFTYLGGEMIVFFTLTLIVENYLFAFDRVVSNTRRCFSCSRFKNAKRKIDVGKHEWERPRNYTEDEDVDTERTRMEEIRKQYKEHNLQSNEDIISLRNLWKIYPPSGKTKKELIAVKDLCLGIPMGQCFGFLGINGAGKTSTMQMMTGDTSITHGEAFVNGYSVSEQLPEVRRELGYCPQFDPLLDLMTAREHLTMFARLRGLPEPTVAGEVKRLIEKLGLAPFADKTAGGYSGGNKRKLSLAIALIGDPAVILLDEPSSGMDPVARRFMWSVISSITANRCVILTTHSMEECEALCNRICIMVNGRMRCLGSIQHLKSRFGEGYHMEINAAEKSFGRVKKFVEEHFVGAILEEFHAGRLKFRLPAQSQTLSSIFGCIEQYKEELGIDDYSVSQSSLEQIFLLMAKEQHSDHRLDEQAAQAEQDKEKEKEEEENGDVEAPSHNHHHQDEQDDNDNGNNNKQLLLQSNVSKTSKKARGGQSKSKKRKDSEEHKHGRDP